MPVHPATRAARARAAAASARVRAELDGEQRRERAAVATRVAQRALRARRPHARRLGVALA